VRVFALAPLVSQDSALLAAAREIGIEIKEILQ
jgi:hypothetical protein